MATLRDNRKLVEISTEPPENTGNNQSRNALNLGMAEKYIAQVSKEIEGQVTKKISQQFSRTESRILGAVSKLDDFLLNPQVWSCSVAVSGTPRIKNSENREPTGDRCLKKPCPEVAFSACRTANLNDSDQEKLYHMVTGVQEEISYCSLGTSSGKQKKTRSTSQSQYRSENTPAKIEADQILLALQRLATDNNSAQFNKNINRILKLPKALTTTMPTFDGKTKKFKLFEDLF